jgi:hypothetical protein
MQNHKILFILKKKKLYDDPNYAKTIHSGLFNSATFVNEMLNANGIESHLVQVIDNNCIDREVSRYKPTDVVIEALWVVPEKFEVLHKLHPKVNWVIRLHSEMPFIANEGNAIEWIFRYSDLAKKYNIKIAPNTIKMYNDLKSIGVENLVYLPNYYPVLKDERHPKHYHRKYINVGCFGAIRPMKNQLIQAVAAIEFGNQIGKPIHFHVNTERIERGDNAIRNIRALFENQTIHKLIEHPWYSHSDFVHLISRMDLGLQLSFNETFNIVAADFVSENIPIIGSDEINWLSCFYKAKATDSSSIVKKMKLAYKYKKYNLQKLNKINLKKLGKESVGIWTNYYKKG